MPVSDVIDLSKFMTESAPAGHACKLSNLVKRCRRSKLSGLEMALEAPVIGRQLTLLSAW